VRFGPVLKEIIAMLKKMIACAFVMVAPLVVGARAFADEPKSAASAEAKAPQLPPGWTEEDMQACILAGTPGKMHEYLRQGAGVWHGKSKMWMVPGAEPVESECVSTVSPIFDGRYTKCEMDGEMPGIGPFKGFGLYGFDNVSQKFVSTWVDNQSTGMMTGEGTLSDDGKVLTWNFTFNCPLTKKSTKLREIETITGPNTKTLEMHGTDPKSGREFKMMTIEFTKKSDVAQVGN
jgi:hypothetical protein